MQLLQIGGAFRLNIYARKEGLKAPKKACCHISEFSCVSICLVAFFNYLCFTSTHKTSCQVMPASRTNLSSAHSRPLQLQLPLQAQPLPCSLPKGPGSMIFDPPLNPSGVKTADPFLSSRLTGPHPPDEPEIHSCDHVSKHKIGINGRIQDHCLPNMRGQPVNAITACKTRWQSEGLKHIIYGNIISNHAITFQIIKLAYMEGFWTTTLKIHCESPSMLACSNPKLTCCQQNKIKCECLNKS
jgi:hypothetical protein